MTLRPGPWLAIPVLVLVCASAGATALIIRSLWVTLLLICFSFLLAYFSIREIVASFEKKSILIGIPQLQSYQNNTIAHKLLSEILHAGSERRPLLQAAQELLQENLQLDKFVIFVREDDRFIPKIIAGLNRNNLASPPVQRLSANLRRGMLDGALSTADIDVRLAYRNEAPEQMAAPIAFAYSWSRSRSVLVVADDPRGDLAQLVRDAEFNKSFWPGLDYIMRTSQGILERSTDLRQANQQLSQARKDLTQLERELKNRMVDIQSFVRVSSRLYSLFNEEQLFQTLIEIVRGQLRTPLAEILVPTGDNKYSARPAGESPALNLTLECNSEFGELITKSSRPVSLPLAATGLKRDEPFLNAAIASGLAAATAIRGGGRTACVLLVGEKGDGTRYSDQDMDFLYAVSNIASLALDNIYQYSTIEKLSYTDSMTGIFNYRYFYKRLNEEILRARRYERELGLVILDIDNFKSFNDNFGHQAGDLILRQLSDLIARTSRSIDVVSRYGGEEFCIIMPDTGAGNCGIFIERLRSQIAESKFESNLFPKGSSISISAGGAVYPHHALTPDRLIYCADMALLGAKALGRNRAIMFEPSTSQDARPVEGGYDESHQSSIFQ